MKWCHPLLLCEDQETMFLKGILELLWSLNSTVTCPLLKARSNFICEKAQLKILLNSAQWTNRNQVTQLTF